MIRYIVLIYILLLFITGLNLGCSSEQPAKVQEVNFDQLFTNPQQYNGLQITLEGFYFQGFEVIVLCEKLEYSGYAEGHLVPKGRMVWIEGGIPKEVYDKAYKQQMMGPLEHYGKVKVKGKFEYGVNYGHLGSYNSQIVPLEVELLLWSPPGGQ